VLHDQVRAEKSLARVSRKISIKSKDCILIEKCFQMATLEGE